MCLIFDHAAFSFAQINLYDLQSHSLYNQLVERFSCEIFKIPMLASSYLRDYCKTGTVFISNLIDTFTNVSPLHTSCSV